MQKIKDRETQDCADIYDWVWDGKGKASVPKPSDPPEGWEDTSSQIAAQHIGKIIGKIKQENIINPSEKSNNKSIKPMEVAAAIILFPIFWAIIYGYCYLVVYELFKILPEL